MAIHNVAAIAYHTPETYLGYERAERFSNNAQLQSDSTYNYTFPAFIPTDH